MDIDRSALPDLVEVEIALLDFDLDDFDLADFVEALLLFLPFAPLMMATVMTVAMSFMFLLIQSLMITASLEAAWPYKRKRERSNFGALCSGLASS